MKAKNIIAGVGLLAIVGVMVACSDNFLNQPPKDSLVDANFYQTDDQLLQASSDLYSASWKDYCDQANWKIGDIKAGLVYTPWAYSDNRDFCTFTITGLSASNVAAYQSFYQVIAQANTLIQNINKYGSAALTPERKNHAIAEARFMRATAYTYLVMNYGAVVIIEDNTKNLTNPAYTRSTIRSVWEFIKRDYLYAAENLLPTEVQKGRLTKWAAEGMLARTYLTIAGVNFNEAIPDPDAGASLNPVFLDSAMYYADRVIQGSGKQLLENYADLFLYPYDNNDESLFELQWVFTTNDRLSYKYANTMVSQITPSGTIAANSDGWGGSWSATPWMLSQYDGLVANNGASTGFTLDQRLPATFMLPGFVYPELTGTDQTFIDASHVIQYTPSGVGADPTDGAGFNYASIKKYVIGKVAESAKQDYPNDTYMLRLAELYMIYAEAAVLKGSGVSGYSKDQAALDHFNAVHERAGLPKADSVSWDGIFSERVKEFAMEGMIWYDLVRLHYHSPQHAYDILNAQDRGLFLALPKPWPNPTGWQFYNTSWFSDRIVNVSKSNFMMDIPQVEKSQAPSLAADPVDYVFSN